MAKKQIDLGLTGLDELFMDDRERAESKLPKIHEIPLSEIDEFPNHPFHVRLDEDMDQLVESIKDIRTKALRSNNPCNVVRATLAGLSELRTAEEVAAVRGKSVSEIL